MKQIKIIILPILSLFLNSCVSTQYLENYEPINIFLETQKIDKNIKHILQRDKERNTQALRIFNGGMGYKHIIDTTEPDYTGGLFVEKHWKKMYKTYANDTIKKYWKKEDFPSLTIILENEKGLLSEDFYNRYLNSRTNEILIISEPMYYMKKKYIMFYFEKTSFAGSRSSYVVVMKKENNKWVVVKIIGDYIFS
jgi:hypothetical protein